MTDLQILTIVITLLAIAGSTYANRKAVEDIRDVLSAEMAAGLTKVSGDIKALEAKLTIHELEHHHR
jgi:hypothetical protein